MVVTVAAAVVEEVAAVVVVVLVLLLLLLLSLLSIVHPVYILLVLVVVDCKYNKLSTTTWELDRNSNELKQFLDYNKVECSLGTYKKENK